MKELKLLTLPQNEDIIQNRIEKLYESMVDTPNAEKYIIDILEMLLDFIDGFEGSAIEQCLYKLQESKLWWQCGWDLNIADTEDIDPITPEDEE